MGITYRIIFTDFSMPIMDGIQATRNIRSIFKDKMNVPRISIIGVTGHVQSEYQKSGLNTGMDEIPIPLPVMIYRYR